MEEKTCIYKHEITFSQPLIRISNPYLRQNNRDFMPNITSLGIDLVLFFISSFKKKLDLLDLNFYSI